MPHEHVFDARSTAVLGVVQAVDDTGQAQTVDVQTHDGITRSAIEVAQFSGFASRAPMAGATVVLIAIGGDVGHYLALPIANPSNRFGNMQEGDGGVLYAPDGTRVAAMADGVLQIVGMTQVQVLAPNVTIEAPQGVAIIGPTSITGSLSVTGNVGIEGDVSVNGNLALAGGVSLKGNLNVSGTITATHINSSS